MQETIPLPKSETKPPASPPKEISKPETPVKSMDGTARATLEKIAGGTPVLEATAPQPEKLPSREETDAILKEANEILLELRDMRLLVNAVATQAADTPLGNEVRMDALRSILTMETQGLPPDAVIPLTKLQEKIKALNLPAHQPENSALLATIASYNELHPDKQVPSEVMEEIKSGKKDVAPTVAQMLQTNNDLAQITWKEITNVDGFTKLNPSPGVILDLAGIAKTPENLQKADELFSTVREMKAPPVFTSDQLVMGLMYGAMGLQFFTQLASPESAGGGGH